VPVGVVVIYTVGVFVGGEGVWCAVWVMVTVGGLGVVDSVEVVEIEGLSEGVGDSVGALSDGDVVACSDIVPVAVGLGLRLWVWL